MTKEQEGCRRKLIRSSTRSKTFLTVKRKNEREKLTERFEGSTDQRTYRLTDILKYRAAIAALILILLFLLCITPGTQFYLRPQQRLFSWNFDGIKHIWVNMSFEMPGN